MMNGLVEIFETVLVNCCRTVASKNIMTDDWFH